MYFKTETIQRNVCKFYIGIHFVNTTCRKHNKVTQLHSSTIYKNYLNK